MQEKLAIKIYIFSLLLASIACDFSLNVIATNHGFPLKIYVGVGGRKSDQTLVALLLQKSW